MNKPSNDAVGGNHTMILGRTGTGKSPLLGYLLAAVTADAVSPTVDGVRGSVAVTIPPLVDGAPR